MKKLWSETSKNWWKTLAYPTQKLKFYINSEIHMIKITLIKINDKVLKVVFMCVLSHVWLFVTSWTIVHQASLSMRFPRQEYWSELPFPPPGDLPYPRIQLFPMSCIGSRVLCTSATWEVLESSKTKSTHIQDENNKDRNGMDLTEAEDIKKRWQEYTEELYQ